MRTSELIDLALDWAVAKCEGLTFEWDGGAAWVYPPEYSDYMAALRVGDAMSINNSFIPSTDWSQGGPIIDKMMRDGLRLMGYKCGYQTDPTGCQAQLGPVVMGGPTPLIAAMRCYCGSKLGYEVEIPEDLR